MPETPHLSDKGLAVFAFAIYHQLESGSRVTQVVRDDGAGHHADVEAIRELQRLGLVDVDNERIGFTKRGEAILDQVIAEMRRAAAATPGTGDGGIHESDPGRPDQLTALRAGYT